MKGKILITGAGGYIGSVATYLFLQKGYSIVALDNFSRGYHEPLELLQKKFGKDRLTIHELDLAYLRCEVVSDNTFVLQPRFEFQKRLGCF